MKKISYLLLLFFSAIVCGCSEYEQPYVGYIVVERAVLDAAANSSTTVIADVYKRQHWNRILCGVSIT